MKNTRKNYEWEMKTGETALVEVTGEYRSSFCKDFTICCGGYVEDIYETDDADEILEVFDSWGFDFVSEKTRDFNRAYIQSVMIDEDATLESLLKEFAEKERGI